jgi:hypothetical protein
MRDQHQGRGEGHKDKVIKKFDEVHNFGLSSNIGIVVDRTAERMQIEWLKFGRFSNKRLLASANQGEYYCFHIFSSLLVLTFGRQHYASGSCEIIVIFYVLSRNLMDSAWPSGQTMRRRPIVPPMKGERAISAAHCQNHKDL